MKKIEVTVDGKKRYLENFNLTGEDIDLRRITDIKLIDDSTISRVDAKVLDYLERAGEILLEFYKGEKTLSEIDAVYSVEIAKMLQREEKS